MRLSRTLSTHFALTFAASVATGASATTFDIPEGRLDQTLLGISHQGGKAISFEQSLVRGYDAPAIKGDFTSAQALQIALRGTGVQESEQGGDIVLSAAPSATTGNAQACEGADISRVPYCWKGALL